ncbi:TraR/DksA family transcriptional regulator [Sphingorhabdus arenilitoris]|uniref:TraR/DksA family transcriptional regulator n=1 Tax=Sphingorhabdus arenilitoris TaxID=1490041 RepID=A0ABV8RFX0_9SPHN
MTRLGYHKLASAKTLLWARLAEHQRRARHIKTDLDEPLDPDFSEQAAQMEDDEALEAQQKMVRRQIAALRAAITRIDNGRYGLCVNCGEPIAEARLNAIPEATLCIACAEQSSR